jgi:hypothetical protein
VRTLLLALWIVAALGLAPLEGWAASCPAAKVGAGGKFARRILACSAVAARKGTSVDGGCTGKATEKCTAGFAKAETTPGCLTAGDATDVENALDALVISSTVGTLRPTQAPSGCAASKFAAAGRYVAAVAAAEGRNAEKPDPVRLADARARALVQIEARFTTADGGKDCITAGDAGTVASALDGVVRVILGKIWPVCGDGIRAGTEECDGPDALSCASATCGTACTCNPACGYGCYDLGIPCCSPTEVCLNGPGILGDQCVETVCSVSSDCTGSMQCETGHCCVPSGLCLAGFPCCNGFVCGNVLDGYGTCCVPAGQPCADASSCCSGSCNGSNLCD